MIMKAFTFLSFFLMVFIGYTQDRWGVGVILSPSISQIDEQSYSQYYEPIYPFNGGIRLDFKYRRLELSYGILHLTQGKKFDGKVTIPSDPEGGTGTVTQKTKIKGFFMPLNVNYFVLDKEHIGSYVGVGLYTGYIYSQTFDPGYSNPVNIVLFDKLYFGVNVDMGVVFRLSPRFNIIFGPNILYQLRKEIRHDDFPAFTPRLCTMSFDVGFFYRFGGIEKNTPKE